MGDTQHFVDVLPVIVHTGMAGFSLNFLLSSRIFN